jgi:hypothetical protein
MSLLGKGDRIRVRLENGEHMHAEVCRVYDGQVYARTRRAMWVVPFSAILMVSSGNGKGENDAKA